MSAFRIDGGHGFLPVQKLDTGRRIVYGIAQMEDKKPDLQGDLVDFDASVRAFKNWAGNIREMHDDIAAGRCIEIIPLPEKNAILVGCHISLGAESTWQKILDGTLRGFSIGGSVKAARTEVDKTTGKKYRRITEYELDELSLVDSPASPNCLFTAVIKTNGVLRKSMLIAGNETRSRKAASLISHRKAADLLSPED